MAIRSSVIDPHLTRIAVQRGVAQNMFHNQMPAVPAMTEDGRYESWDPGLFIGTEDAGGSDTGVRAISGKYRSFEFGVTPVTFTMEEMYAFKSFDWREGNFSTGPTVFEKGMEAVNARHNIVREQKFHDLMFATGSWTNVAVGAGDRFDNAASNPPGYMREQWTVVRRSAAGGSGARKVVIMAPSVRDKLAKHPVYTAINANSEVTGFATHETMAASFGVTPADFWVPEAVQNTGKKATTVTHQDIFNESYIWMGYLPTNIDQNSQTAAAYIHLGASTPTVMRGETDTGEERGRWMRESSIGVYQAIDTGAASLLTGVIS